MWYTKCPLNPTRVSGGAQRVRAEPRRQTHFGAIHSPKFANLLKFYPRAQNVHATFYDFFLECRFCRCCNCSSSRSGQSHTEYISCIFEATFLPRFAKQDRRCSIPNVLLIQLGCLGSAVSSTSGSGRSPAAERYLLHFMLKKSF